MRRLGVVACLFAGCGRVDFDAPRPFVPSHLTDSVPLGAIRLQLGNATIDTTTLTIDGLVPAGARFLTSPQPGGGDLAVLHVAALTISDGATVRVVGSRPLVIVASSTIDIEGTLDAGAKGDVAGPGGAPARTGAGLGGDAPDDGTNCDPGGGGGGFAQPGADGGAQCLTTARGGTVYGAPDLSILIGGSSGGLGASTFCPAQRGPSAGGGAVQLTAFDAIRIAPSGSISAGGGGGVGGPECGMGDAGGGSGGGSGGAIFLEARGLEVDGEIRVDGGGGGAGGNGQPQNGDISDGEPGGDGTAEGPGAGGVSRAFVNNTAANGGRGGTAMQPALPGLVALNGGGGGGGAGYIVVRVVD